MSSGPVGGFVFTSAEFMDGMDLPEDYTCASPEGFSGAHSPSFTWSGAPAETQSFAMIMIDKTLVDDGVSTGYHSALWDLPATVTSLPTQSPMDLKSMVEAEGGKVINNGYLGPCPGLANPPPPPPHTYVFMLYAMPEATTAGVGQMLSADFVTTFEDAALAKVELSCTSSAMGGF